MASVDNNNAEDTSKRTFKDISNSEIEKIFNNRKSKATQEATKLWMRAFRDFLKEKKLPEPEELTNEELWDVLHIFYPSVQKKDNTDLKTTTLKGIRAAINRFYRDRKGIDIVSDPFFLVANEMFKGVIMKNKENGLSTIDHKKVIEIVLLRKERP